MPRKPRIDAPGLLYHIIARGIERRSIFRDDADRKFFLRRLGRILTETQTRIYAFALIPNHFHLLLRRDRTPIQKVMLRLLTSHAIYFNKRHRRAGHLFQNRYKAIICQEELYFLELVRYINLNPLNAGIVDSLDELTDYPYTSHSHLLGKKSADWFDVEQVLSFFGTGKSSSRQAYRRFIAAGNSAGEGQDLDGGGLKRSLGFPACSPKEMTAHDERVLGVGDFVEGLCGRKIDECTDISSASFEELLDDISRVYDIPATSITGRTKVRKAVEARRVLAYRLYSEIGMTGCDIARRLSLSRSTVSRMIRIGEVLLKKNATNATTSPTTSQGVV
jgi:putative transposase